MALATLGDVLTALRSTDLGSAATLVDSSMVLGDQVLIFDSNGNLRLAAISDVVGDPDHTLAGDNTYSGTSAFTGASTFTGTVTSDVLKSAEHGAGAIGTGAIGAPDTYRRIENSIIITTIKIDITGLGVKGGNANDVIGLVSGAPDAYIGKYVTSTYGIVYKITMTCIELPAGTNITTDINLTVSATGTFGYDEGASNDYLFNTGGMVANQILNNITPSTLTNDDFIYLTEGDTAASTGTYTAGQYIITFYGHPLLV